MYKPLRLLMLTGGLVTLMVNTIEFALAQSRADDGGTAVTADNASAVNSGNGTLINKTGISDETVREIVRAIVDKQEAAGLAPDRQQAELEAVYALLADWKSVAEVRKEENAKMHERLALLEDGAAKNKLERALQLCEDENCAGAAKILNDVVETGNETVAAVAEARYQLGLIAEQELRVLDAAEQFELAARLAPNFDRLDKASEFQILIGEFDKAETLAHDLVVFSVKHFGEISEEAAEANWNLAYVLNNNGRVHESLDALRLAAKIGRSVPGQKPEDLPKFIAEYATGLLEIGSISEAERNLVEAIKISEEDDRTGPEIWSFILQTQSRFASERGDFSAALALQQQAVELEKNQDPNSATGYAAALAVLTGLYAKINDIPAAVANAEEALGITEALLGPTHKLTIDRKVELLIAKTARQGVTDFVEQMRGLTDLMEQAVGKTHPTYVSYLQTLGLQLLTTGKLDESRNLVEQALAQTEAIFGKDHERYAEALSSLSTVEFHARNFPRALELQREALARMRDLFGDQHFEFAEEAHGLGLMLLQAGRPDEALPYLEEAGGIFLATYGPDDPDYASSLGFQALALHFLGRSDEALRRAKQAADIADAATEFPTFRKLNTQQFLGKIYYEQGRLHEAEPHMQAVISMAGDVTGSQLLQLTAKISLGAILANTNRNEDAIVLLEPLVEEIRSMAGEYSSHYGMAQMNFGASLLRLSQFEKAETAMREAVRALDREETPDLFAGLASANLGYLLIESNRVDEGLSYVERALEIEKHMLGERSPNYISSLALLARTQSDHGFYAEAEENARRAADLAKAHLAPEVSAYTEARSTMSDILVDADRIDEAVENQADLVAVLAASDELLPQILIAQKSNLAVYLENAGRIDEAIEAFRELVELNRANAEGTTPNGMVLHMSNLASFLNKRGDWDEAEARYREALEIAQGIDDPKAEATATDKLADFLAGRNRRDEALDFYETAIDLSKEASGSTSVETANHMFALSNFYWQEERFSRAYRYLDRALSALEGSVGTDHEIYARFLRHRSRLERDLLEFEESEASLLEAEKVNRLFFDEDHVRHSGVASSFARLKRQTGDLDGAESYARQALSILEAHKVDATFQKMELAEILRFAGKFSEAEEILRSVLGESKLRTTGETHQHINAQIALARVLLSKEDFEAANALAADAAARAESALPNDKILRVIALALSSRALTGLEELERAETTAEAALKIAEEHKNDELFAGYIAKLALAKLKIAKGEADANREVEDVLDYLSERFGDNSATFLEAAHMLELEAAE